MYILQYGFLHIVEFSQIIHEGEENIKRETDEDGQIVRVMELRSAGNKRKGYFLIQVITSVCIIMYNVVYLCILVCNGITYFMVHNP